MIHDVFISAKSADYQYAKQIYQFLVARGIRAFFSQQSLPELGNSDYRKEIDRKLDEAQNMVVVASSIAHAESPWVEAEWGFFVNEKRSGRKAGNLVTVTVGSLEPKDLPASLRYYEVIPFGPEACEKVLRYVAPRPRPGSKEPALAAPAERPEPCPAERTTDGFTNSLGARLVRISQDRTVRGDASDVPLYVSAACVSNRDYQRFVESGGPPPASGTKSAPQTAWSGKRCDPSMLDHPVVFVRQESARQFCDWLTATERAAGVIGPTERYSLPSLAQWRAVAAGVWLTQDTVLQRTWQSGQRQPTEPVCSGEPHAPGLFHLLGNVFEWCLDAKIRDVKRSDGRLFRNTHCYVAVGGGWASTYEWLQKGLRKKQYGAILCPDGWPMKDGGFRIWLCSTTPPPGAGVPGH